MTTRKNNINIIIVQRSWGGWIGRKSKRNNNCPILRTYVRIHNGPTWVRNGTSANEKENSPSVLSDKVFMVLAIHYAFMLVIPPRPRSVRVLPAIVFIAVHLHPRRWFGRKLQPLLARADTFPHPIYHFSFRQQHSRLIYFFLRQSIRPNQCCT